MLPLVSKLLSPKNQFLADLEMSLLVCAGVLHFVGGVRRWQVKRRNELL